MSGRQENQVGSSAREALKILEMLANSRAGLTLAEVARHLGLARSSTHYLLLTLERTGYLYREQTNEPLHVWREIIHFG